MNKNRQSLSKWYSESLVGFCETLKTQDRYLHMNAAALLEYVMQHNETLLDKIPDEDVSGQTVANVVQNAVVHLNLAMEEGDVQEIVDETDMLYALLIFPFAQWIVNTDYVPEPEFLEGTCLL